MSKIAIQTVINILADEETNLRISMKESNIKQDAYLNNMVSFPDRAGVWADSLRKEEENFGKLLAKLEQIEKLQKMIT